MARLYDKEKTLYREVAPRVERSVPGVEVLAVELGLGHVRTPSFVPRGLCGSRGRLRFRRPVVTFGAACSEREHACESDQSRQR